MLKRGGQQVGELTSWGDVPAANPGDPAIQIALGYIRRDAMNQDSDSAAPIEYEGGAAVPIASPVSDLASRS